MSESPDSPQLKIATLGGLSIRRGDEPVTGLTSHKAQALLVYLASSGRAQEREVLAELLWYERAPESALGNLRGVIHSLRGELEAYLEIGRDTLAVRPELIWLDVGELEAQLDAIERPGAELYPARVEEIARALELYRGEFLLGFPAGESRGFEEWMTLERERLNYRVFAALERVADWYLEQGQYPAGISQAVRLLQLDPLREASHRRLMQLLALSGQRQAALGQYESCRRLLDEELGVAPEAETTALFEQIQSGEGVAAKVRPADASAEAGRLPRGTVTFLFTDIEGSTEHLRRLGDRYADLLAQHHALLRMACARFQGEEVDHQGDSLFFSFGRATNAVGAAVEAQRGLAAAEWPEGVSVRVRMGLHTGEPWLVEAGYVGMDVHRAARIGAVGHGGQVLLSETTAVLVQHDLPEGIELIDLGRHRLKDVRRPRRIHQLAIGGLAGEFPALNTLEALPEHAALEGEEARSRPPRDVGLSPFRGLAAFREEDAQFFFGREEFTEQLSEAVHQGRLAAVIVGASGSGKSSAVFAGLLPRLREVGDWLIVQMRPGAQPFLALAGALLPLVEHELSETAQMIEARKMGEGMRTGELALAQVVERLLAKEAGAGRMLLVIDQFEEVYTLCPDGEERAAFHDELLAAVAAGSLTHEPSFALLLTLRADFMGQALAHRPFADALQEGSLMLGPMNREELREAIVRPGEMQGAAFETGLVERLLDDVGQEPGNLPLLEFALTLLWDRMEGGWLTHAAYEEIGRVEGSLARYANEVYEKLNSDEREQARRAFVQLVQPGEGTEDTRRIARREELVGVAWVLVQHLADERLVVTGQDELGRETVEVVHEALIRGWGQLREWMDADRDFRRWQEGLRGARRGWEETGRDEGALLHGMPLANAESWLEKRGEELGPAEVAYIEASQDSRARAGSGRAAAAADRRGIGGGAGGGAGVEPLCLQPAECGRGAAAGGGKRSRCPGDGAGGSREGSGNRRRADRPDHLARAGVGSHQQPGGRPGVEHPVGAGGAGGSPHPGG